MLILLLLLRRQQTPFAVQEDFGADYERTSSVGGRQTPFYLQPHKTVSLDQLNKILRESNIPLHNTIDRLWSSVCEIRTILTRLYTFIEMVNQTLENSFNRLLESSNEQVIERLLIVELLCAINSTLFSRKPVFLYWPLTRPDRWLNNPYRRCKYRTALGFLCTEPRQPHCFDTWWRNHKRLSRFTETLFQ